MTSERSLWHTTQRWLSPHGALERVENSAGPGTPDVAYCLGGRAGWLELKEVGEWPVRPMTRLRVPALKLEQVLFAERWTRAGGSVYLLLQVERTYLLLSSWHARQVYERELTRSDLTTVALACSQRRFPAAEVLRCLRGY